MAEPTKANQNGAVTAVRLGEHPAERGADDQAAEDADRVDAADATLQLARHGTLADRHRGRAPHEGMQPEDEEDGHRHRRRGRERESEVRQRLDDQADAHDVAEAHPSGDPSVRDGPDQAPDCRDGRDQPEADVSKPEALARVQDQHRPGRSERDVEDEDRQHQRSHRGVVPHPTEALGDLVTDRRRAAPGRGCAAAA